MFGGWDQDLAFNNVCILGTVRTLAFVWRPQLGWHRLKFWEISLWFRAAAWIWGYGEFSFLSSSSSFLSFIYVPFPHPLSFVTNLGLETASYAQMLSHI